MFVTKNSVRLLAGLAVSLFTSAAIAISPDDIAGLKIWLKADSLSLTNGAAVVDWNDSSVQAGSASKATQSTVADQPVFLSSAINSLPAVRFTANDSGTVGDWMQIFNASSVHGTLSDFGLASGGITVFAVVDANTSNDAGRNRAPIWGDNEGYLDFVDSSVQMRTRREAVLASTNPTPGPAGFHIATFTHTELGASLSNDLKVFANGTSVATNTGTNSASNLGTAASLTNLGATTMPGAPFNGDAFFGGDLAELIVYDGLLSASQLNDVGYYMEQKYALDTAYLPPVPEPSTGILAAIGLIALVRRGRQRRMATIV